MPVFQSPRDAYRAQKANDLIKKIENKLQTQTGQEPKIAKSVEKLLINIQKENNSFAEYLLQTIHSQLNDIEPFRNIKLNNP